MDLPRSRKSQFRLSFHLHYLVQKWNKTGDILDMTDRHNKFLVSCQTTIGEMSFIPKEWSDVVVTLSNYGKTGHPEPSPGWYFTLYRLPES